MRLLVIKCGAKGLGLQDEEARRLEPGRGAQKGCPRPQALNYRELLPGPCFTEEGPEHQFSRLSEKVHSVPERCIFHLFLYFHVKSVISKLVKRTYSKL